MAKSKDEKTPVGLRLEKSLVEDLDAALARFFGNAANRSWAIHQAIRDFIVTLDSAGEAMKSSKAADAKRKKG